MRIFGAMLLGAGLLAGCSTPQQRMADCEAQGISRDTCYLSEQNRRNALLGAAERQALENAQRQSHHRR
ncbi:hypothetical protein HB662_06315 [Roseomonas frigidaquae]|uniref:Lipoprotein n=1 Tax=Falsiroseomonas frigidaquae TaxID=487318 RepID=A0ABX1EUR7_9PROT|nr:hypothetical protein [Falsiroseomonas frigidaquae]NKE44384.1 hypothetical protein [Falsiroseomonas frigidaquae]